MCMAGARQLFLPKSCSITLCLFAAARLKHTSWPKRRDRCIHMKLDQDRGGWHRSAVRAVVFLGAAAVLYVAGGLAFDYLPSFGMAPCERADDDAELMRAKQQVEHAIDRLCDLDGSRMLADHGIGMAAGWEQARKDALARLAGNDHTPSRLLRDPINFQTATMPYTDIGEGELVSEAFMRREMVFLFD